MMLFLVGMWSFGAAEENACGVAGWLRAVVDPDRECGRQPTE